MSFNHRLKLTSQETIILKISEISCLIVILKSEFLPISIKFIIFSCNRKKYNWNGLWREVSICQD